MNIPDWIEAQREGHGVLSVRMKNAPVNAFSAESLIEFGAFFRDMAQASQINAVLLSSDLKVFSAGLNLKEAQLFTIEQQSEIVNSFHACYLDIYGFSKPLISAVSGAAIAGGLFPVLCSDYRLGTSKALFGLAEVRVGVGLPAGLMEIVRASVHPNDMRLLLQNGQPFSAQKAHEAGIVDEIVEEQLLYAKALEVAHSYAQLPPQAFATVKDQVRRPVIDRLAAEVKASKTSAPKAWFSEETTAAMAKMLGA